MGVFVSACEPGLEEPQDSVMTTVEHRGQPLLGASSAALGHNVKSEDLQCRLPRCQFTSWAISEWLQIAGTRIFGRRHCIDKAAVERFWGLPKHEKICRQELLDDGTTVRAFTDRVNFHNSGSP